MKNTTAFKLIASRRRALSAQPRRATWTEGPRTSLKKLERLRAFMRFSEKRKWIDGNPATELKAPKVPSKPTMPFTREEMIRILAALEP